MTKLVATAELQPSFSDTAPTPGAGRAIGAHEQARPPLAYAPAVGTRISREPCCESAATSDN